MGRRLAEATKARRTLRTRGEAGLRFFLVVFVWALVAAAVFFLLFLAVGPLSGVLAVGVDDWDWAAAGCKKPSQSRDKIPANTATAKRRTQTLPSAENWHP